MSQRLSRVLLLVCLALSVLPHHLFAGRGWVLPVETVSVVLLLVLLGVQLRRDDRKGPYADQGRTLSGKD